MTVAVSNSCRSSKKCSSGRGAVPADAILLGTWFIPQQVATRVPTGWTAWPGRKKTTGRDRYQRAPSPHRGIFAWGDWASGPLRSDDHHRLPRRDGLALASDDLDHDSVDR